MEIIPVKYAKSVLPESEIFKNGDKSKGFIEKYRADKYSVLLCHDE